MIDWTQNADQGEFMAFTIKQHKLAEGGKAVSFVQSPYIGGALPDPTKIVVMHFTYGGSARSSANWFKDPKNPGSSAHVVVERDGGVIQCVPFNTVAWHAGKSRLRDLVGLNQFSIGIELANWGYLQPLGDRWASYTGTAIAKPFMGVHKNGNPNKSHVPIGWEHYPVDQFDAAVQIVRLLVSTYGIDEIVGHDDISPGRKWDPGPAFDMLRFRNLVFGDRMQDGDIRLKVLPQDGLNLRAGPGTQFASIALLSAGTLVEPISEDGLWISVSLIGTDGQPTKTGWVHSKYVGPV
jgi:N-acetylmuramoyl-L-alanine amidase